MWIASRRRGLSTFTSFAVLATGVCVASVLATVAVTPRTASAGTTTYVVDDERDLVDDAPGDGSCHTAQGTCTLRAAVMESEATPPVPGDVWDWTVIDLTGLVGPWPTADDGPCPVVSVGATACAATDWPLPIHLSLGGPGDDDPASGDLDITTPTVIQGGAKTLLFPFYQELRSRVVGNHTDRIFDVHLDPAYLQGTYNWTVAPAFSVNRLRIEHASACADGSSTAGDCVDEAGLDGSGYRLRGTWAQLVDVEGEDVGVGDASVPQGSGGFISHERPDGFPADTSTLDLWNDVKVGNAIAQRGAAVATDDARIHGITETGFSSWADMGGLLYVAPGGRVEPLQIGDLVGGRARLGGAVYADSGSVVRLRTISSAQASVAGGGIFLESVSDEYGASAAWLVGIIASTAGQQGGGAYVDYIATLHLSAEAKPDAWPFYSPPFVSSNFAGSDFPAAVAGQGGGIYNRGNLTIDGGDVESNVARSGGAGGGIFNTAPGRVTLTNVALLNNSATTGSHLDNEGAGVADLRFVSTHGAKTDDPYGPAYGIAASSPVTLVASLLADDTLPGDVFMDAEGCTGTVHLEVGAVIPGATANAACATDGVAPIDADPLLQVPYGRDDLAPLDSGTGQQLPGSDVVTLAFTPGPDSPALDAVPLAVCATWTAVDSRGFARPGVSATAPCDLGAIERNARLEPLTVSLSADRATSPIGVTDLPLDLADPSLLDVAGVLDTTAGGVPSTAAATTLGAIGIEGSAVPGQPSALAAIPVRSIDVEATPVRSIPLTAVPLSSVPVRSIDFPNGWADVLAGTGLAGAPLQTLSLGEILDSTDPVVAARVDQLSLSEVDLTSTPVRSIPLAAVALAGLPVRSIPLPGLAAGSQENADAWCALVVAAGATCGAQPGDDIDPSRDSVVALGLAGVPVRSIPVRSIPVRSIPVRSIPVRSIPVRSIDLGATPIGAVPVRSIDLTSTPVRSIPFASIPVRSIPVRSIPVRSIDLATAPVRSIPVDSILFAGVRGRVIPVWSIALADVPGACDGTLLDVAAVEEWNGGAPCSSVTLADVPSWALLDTATLEHFPALWDLLELADLPTNVTFADLIDASGQLPLDVTLAELGSYGDLQLADLLDAIAPDADLGSIGDLLRSLLPRADYPWGQVDLDTAPLAAQTDAQPNRPITYTLRLGGSSSGAVPSLGPVTPAAILPPGATYVRGSTSVNGAPAADPTSTRTDGGGTRLQWVATSIGTATTLTFLAHPSLDLAGGSVEAEVTSTVGVAATPITRTATETVVLGPSFEPNDTVAQATPIEPSRLYLSQLQAPGDVDVFSITVPAGAQLSVSLANLPADFDLALFAPVGGGTLRQSTSRSIVPGVDPELDGVNAPVVDQAPVAQDIGLVVGRPLYASSTRRETADEVIDTPSLTAGTYIIQISGYNGASSTKPYTLRTKLVTPPSSRPACVARNIDWSAAAPSAAVPEGVDTLVLVAPTRTAQLRGADEATLLVDAVDAFAAAVNDTTDAVDHGTTVGVLRVDDDPAVRAAYDVWDTSEGRCDPERANDVVRAIGALIDAAGPTVHNIVIAGGDAIVPFARLEDGTSLANEREYAAEFTGNNELIAALEAGMFLSDNPYGDATPIGVGTRELYVPDIAVGRLVESSADIAAALVQFVTSGGVLDPTTAANVSTGYEFLSDGADAVRDAFDANGVVPSGFDLISDTWTSDDLRSVFTAAPGSLLGSINAHFDHSRALSAAESVSGSQDDLFGVDEPSIGGAGTRTGSILFSMGCHAGLSVDGTTFVDDTTPTEALTDWAERFAGAGAAVWAANTGYGYGDTDVVAVSEALMAGFAGAIDGTSTIGAAMVRAKQRYVADLGVVSPYDEKVVGEVAFYGLPMYRVAGVSPGSDLEPITPTVDPATGLYTSDVSIVPTFTEHVADSGRGRFWSADDGTQVTNQRPIQPKVTVDVTPTAGVPVIAAGAVIESATSVDIPGVDPVLARPVVDLGANEPEPFVVGSAFPSTLQTVNPWTDADGTARQQLVVVPGQFLATSAASGVQRRFDQVSARVYYRDPAASGDVEPPSITRVVGNVVGAAGEFEVQAADASGVARVVVLWTDADRPGTWTSVDLAPTRPAPAGTSAARRSGPRRPAWTTWSKWSTVPATSASAPTRRSCTRPPRRRRWRSTLRPPTVTPAGTRRPPRSTSWPRRAASRGRRSRRWSSRRRSTASPSPPSRSTSRRMPAPRSASRSCPATARRS